MAMKNKKRKKPNNKPKNRESVMIRKEEPVEAIDSEPVFSYFREICAIPHGSGHTAAISEYLVSFAKEHGYPFRKDSADNVVIFCPASPGLENAEPLILQGHMDMVLEKESGKEIDMVTEPITVIEEGDWIRADGTTLGGDDGIAVAMMLALMDDRTIRRPPLECIITADEETGMIGAQALDLSGIKGRKMINIDSEQEGIITAGCAGGAEVHQKLRMRRKEREGFPLSIRVSGLLGGHSGEAIRLGRANAVYVLGRLLYELLGHCKFRLVAFEGGGKDNAIPREACAQILLSRRDGEEDRMQQIIAQVKAIGETLRHEFELTDPGMEISCEENDTVLTTEAFSRKATLDCLRYLMTLPDGVLAYSPSFAGLPQTSLNLGILRTEEDGIKTVFLVRSSIESQKRMLVEKLHCAAYGYGAGSKVVGTYPAWEYKAHSPFRDTVAALYEQETGKAPEVAVIHGGLECGLLSAKIPGLECVSIGPDLIDIHTPAERLSRSSTERLWKFLRSLVQHLAEASPE